MPINKNVPFRNLSNSNKLSNRVQITKLIQQGLEFIQKKKYSQAKEKFHQALTLQPNNFNAVFLTGTVSALLKQYSDALKFFSNAIKIDSGQPNCHFNLGLALQELKHHDKAITSFNNAINIKPDYAEAYCSRGFSLQELKYYEQASLSYSQAIILKPDFAEAYYNHAIILHKINCFKEAITSYEQAIALQPDYAEAYYNRGISQQKLNRVEEAIASFKQAVSIKPDYAEARWNLSLAQLLDGNFEQGLLGYEWRWKSEELLKFIGVRKVFLQPLWLGEESLKDKAILLHAEQGFGDTIQFCRYAHLVAKLGAKVFLEVQPPLVQLLNSLEGVNQIIANGSELPDFDYQCPLLSLPLAFKTTLENIPSLPGYIKNDKEKLIKWQAHLGEKLKPRIGIVCSGSAAHKNDRNRSLTLSKLVEHLPSNYEYISLHKEVRDIDQQVLIDRSEIKHFGNMLEDFSDTAALCGLMDLVISVDTSVAHLAAALGIPTWVLLPYNPDWRWLLDREDSPWYSSVKLYRQTKIDDWTSVFEKIKSDLRSLSLNE